MATYDKMTSLKNEGRPVQVESAIRDGSGKNIENNYAKQNGYYAQLTSGKSQLADNLTPYSEDSGAEQEQPFISQGTGCGNGTEIVTTGDYALLREKQGHSLVVNQQVFNGVAKDYNNRTPTPYGSEGKGYNNLTDNAYNDLVVGHKVLTLAKVSNLPSSLEYCAFIVGGETLQLNSTKTADIKIYTVVNNTNKFIRVYTSDTNVFSITIDKYEIIDLTQMFNGNIPQDLLDHPENFFRYYNGSLAYNAGSLESSNGRYLVATGRNLFDEVMENGYYSATTGEKIDETNNLRSANFIPVIPNSQIYIKTPYALSFRGYDANKNFITNFNTGGYMGIFNIPSNVCFITFFIGKATYGHDAYNYDITISPYYTPEQGGEGYDQYYPHEEPTIVDTGSEVLRSAGNAHDYKTPDSTIHRKIGSYTFTGNETWNSSGSAYYTNIVGVSDLIKKPSDNTSQDSYWIICNANIIATYPNALYLGQQLSGIAVATSGAIWIGTNDYANISNLTGKTIYFELAEETTEQGTTFPENIKINDYGMMYWLDSSNNLVGIPQGNKLFYPVNYKGFVDDTYSRTGGDASKLVLQEELSASETARDTVDAQLQNAIGGTLRNILASSQSIDFLNTDVVDLGNVSISAYNSATGLFYCQPTNAKNGAKNICSIFKSVVVNNANDLNNEEAGFNPSGAVYYMKSSAFINKTSDQVQALLKGVLLAYEKASS